MLPFKRTRAKTLYKFFRAYSEINIQNKRGYGSGEPLQGVAFWNFPDQGDVSVRVKSMTIFLPLLFTFYPIGMLRAGEILRQIDTMHQKYAAEPHYYLDNLAILPASQGKGISSKLIRPILEKADAEKVIAYTDTVTRSNVAIYEHFGFRCVEEKVVENTGITVWALRRSPPG
jgi:ribosomal protein S18 acetylase RimI-like enzyme